MASEQDPRIGWRPTKEFLLSGPRSAQIRDVCVGIVRRLNALLYDPAVGKSSDRQSQLYAELEAQGGKLIELGIEPEMHVGKPFEEFQASPVITAEWVAGQFYRATGVTVASETAVMPIIEELSENPNGQPFMGSANIPPRLKDFGVMSTLVRAGYSFLDMDSES